MKVYRPAVLEGYEWVVPADETAHSVIDGLDGTSRVRGWSPVRVRILHEDEEGRPMIRADFPWLGTDALVLRHETADAVASLLFGYGELLPLECDEGPLFIFNLTRVVDALDAEKSRIVRFSTGRVLNIEKYVFKPEQVDKNSLFKIPQTRDIHVSEDFVGAFETLRLSGLGFQQLWERSS